MNGPTKTMDQISVGLLKYFQLALEDSSIAFDVSLTPVKGGNETYIYKFQLKGAPPKFAQPLILRLFPAYRGDTSAIWETAIHNALADQGYPVPRIHFICTDPALLGGAFCVMEFMEGDGMDTLPIEVLPDRLGELHATLHNIDPGPIFGALHAQGVLETRFEGRLSYLSSWAVSRYSWLVPGVRWLLENRPPEPVILSICHCDFHPQNVLVRGQSVAGVLDWGSSLFADPVLDVAFTVELALIHGENDRVALERGDSLTYGQFVERYLAAYAGKRRLSFEYLPYYRVMRCMAVLLEGALGQEYWRDPVLIRNAVDYIAEVTQVRISPPDY